MTKQEHKYAQVLRWIADGEELQTQGSNGHWIDTGHHSALMDICEGLHPDRFRIKPRTIRVNGVEVPAPEKCALPNGTNYYLPAITNDDFYYEAIWEDISPDSSWLARGLVYLRKEDAIARAKAMLLTQE